MLHDNKYANIYRKEIVLKICLLCTKGNYEFSMILVVEKCKEIYLKLFLCCFLLHRLFS